LAHPRYPLIVINTKRQTRGRRLFTLIHELAHVLMGQTGISDPFIRKNAIETRCNQFASRFLVPKAYLALLLKNVTPPADPGLDDVARIARRLKISQQATIIRLEELRLVRAGSHERWLRAIHNTGNPDYSERGGGGAGGPPPQEKVKLAKYGFHFAAAFDAPLRQGRISEINLYRATGLKPKYQRQYFEFAKSIDNTELQNLDLDNV
jgi:IrrE N-terminal-like domain